MGDFDDSFRPEANQTTTRLVERTLPEQGPAESNDTLVSLTAPKLTKINDKTRPKSSQICNYGSQIGRHHQTQ
jgi:hypothetical protein